MTRSIRDTITFHDRKNWFTIQVWLLNDRVVSFRAFQITEIHPDGTLYYAAKESEASKKTNALVLAQTYCSGDIKWDGCMNLRFDSAQNDCVLHFCKNPGKKLKDLMDRLFDMAEQLLPTPPSEPIAVAA